MTSEFKLSATLRGHEDDVRGLVFPNQNLIFSVSRDNTLRQWTLTSPKPPVYDGKIAIQGQRWFNAVGYAPPSPKCVNGIIAGGGQEAWISVNLVGRGLEEDLNRMLFGHENTIACLAFTSDGTKLVSGGWDSQALVWNVEEDSVIVKLEGHGGPVWGVLIYDDKFILTGCADKIIRLFDINGKALSSFQGHTDVVRCFAKLPPDHWSGAAIASAGNDEVIRLWTLEGQQVAVLEGHGAYIYSLAILPNGDLVSSSEDRTVKIWRNGQSIQTITHPALSIWSVAACPETGDIVSGASDSMIRIFSRDPERQADAQTLEDFEERIRMYAIPAEAASQGLPFKKENLPGPDILQTKIGDQDGQQLFILEPDGSVTAYLWSLSTGKWNMIGTVVMGEGTSSKRKVHEGQEYDYVFDIDIEDGKPPLKLPYNLRESAWDAARKFLEKNELPMSYYEQVANWIAENTKAATFSQDYPSTSNTRPCRLPQKKFTTIVEGQPENAVRIIAQSNGELLSSGKITVDQALRSDEVDAIKDLAHKVNKQDPRPTERQTTALLKVASHWPRTGRVPAIGLLARLAVSADFVSQTSAGDNTIVETLAAAGLLAPQQETPNTVVHAIRLLVNLFATTPGRIVAEKSFDKILELVRPFAKQPESSHQSRALASLYLNHAVSLTTSGDESVRQARGKTLIVDIATLIDCRSPHAPSAAPGFTLLAALGTLLSLGTEFKGLVKDGIKGTLEDARQNPAFQEPKVREVLWEIRDLLA